MMHFTTGAYHISNSRNFHHMQSYAICIKNIIFSFLIIKLPKCWNSHVDTLNNNEYKYLATLQHVSSLMEHWDEISRIKAYRIQSIVHFENFWTFIFNTSLPKWTCTLQLYQMISKLAFLCEYIDCPSNSFSAIKNSLYEDWRSGVIHFNTNHQCSPKIILIYPWWHCIGSTLPLCG